MGVAHTAERRRLLERDEALLLQRPAKVGCEGPLPLWAAGAGLYPRPLATRAHVRLHPFILGGMQPQLYAVLVAWLHAVLIACHQ
jgi:hypothetical protein